MLNEIFKLALVLTLICVVSASSLQFVRVNVEDRIEQQSDFYVRGPALSTLFDQPAEELLANKIKFKWEDQTLPIFYNRVGDDIIGLAIETAGKGGYGGDIFIMIGIDLQTEKILGLEIIQHSETPGVGSQVEKPIFRRQWKGLPVHAGVELKSNGGTIDAISGATYSSKAVVQGTGQIVDLFRTHLDDIVQAITEKESSQTN